MLQRTMQNSPRCLASANTGAASSADMAKGFSTSTCLPARSASSACVACCASGVATYTTSTWLSATSAAKEPCACANPNSAAKAAAVACWRLPIATTSQSGEALRAVQQHVQEGA